MGMTHAQQYHFSDSDQNKGQPKSFARRSGVMGRHSNALIGIFLLDVVSGRP